MSIALAAVTSLIRVYRFPFGGSVTLLSMLFIMFPAWMFGVREGMICGLLYGLIQLAMDPCIITPLQVIMDYVLAFSVMGIAGFWKDAPGGLLKGYLAAVLARWLMASLAGLVWVSLGYTAWEGWSPLPYSMAYNGAYIFTEAAVTAAVLCIPAVKKNLERIKISCR